MFNKAKDFIVWAKREKTALAITMTKIALVELFSNNGNFWIMYPVCFEDKVLILLCLVMGAT